MSYQGPEFLRSFVTWSGLKLFDRAEKLSLFGTKDIESKYITPEDIEALEYLKKIETNGTYSDCKTHLASLIPHDRLSHFEMEQGRCTAILK